MIDLFKGVCIVVLVVCVCMMIFSIYNAIQTSRRNKAADETTRKIFMAKLQSEKNGTPISNEAAQKTSVYLKQPLVTIEQEKPKSLNYDEYEEDLDLNVHSDKSLKDFFSA